MICVIAWPRTYGQILGITLAAGDTFPLIPETATMNSVNNENVGYRHVVKDTKNLSTWSRRVDVAMLVGVFGLYVGEHRLPPTMLTAGDFRISVWVLSAAVIALVLDGAQVINNLVAHRRRGIDIERGKVDEVVFGVKEFQYRFSWWLFYAKLGITSLGAFGFVLIFARVLFRLKP